MVPDRRDGLEETVPHELNTQMVFSPLAKEEARFARIETTSTFDGAGDETMSVRASDLRMELSPTPVVCLHAYTNYRHSVV